MSLISLPDDIIKYHILPLAPLAFVCMSKRWHHLAAIELYNGVKVWHHRYYIPAIKALYTSGNRHLIASFTRTAYTHELPTGYDWRRLPETLFAHMYYSTSKLNDVLMRYRDWVDVDIRNALELSIDVKSNNKPYPFTSHYVNGLQ